MRQTVRLRTRRLLQSVPSLDSAHSGFLYTQMFKNICCDIWMVQISLCLISPQSSPADPVTDLMPCSSAGERYRHQTPPPLCPIYQLWPPNYMGLLCSFVSPKRLFLFVPPSVYKWALWQTLVSPDSYIANQSTFSSINDKDLHYYKNLRNL